MVATLAEVATELDFTFFGFFVLNGLAVEYHFTRYPRRKYGLQPIEKCEAVLQKVSDLLMKKDKSVSVAVEQIPSPYKTRVILGLQEGYSEGNEVHSLNEVREALDLSVSCLGVQIYTLSSMRQYTEPAAMILDTSDDVQEIYALAAAFMQERFTVENFISQQAYVVETPHAKHPDSE